MGFRRIAVITAAGLTVAGGAGAAIAATARDEGKKAEDNVLRDAADDLNVSPSRLRDALRDATAAQLDRELERAVRAGELTQAQADEIKSRRKESGRVLGIGPGAGHRPGQWPGFRHGGFTGGPRRGGGPLEDVAKALGIGRAELFSQLRGGKTISEIAKGEGKTLDDVKKAVAALAKARLDEAVKDGDLTARQARAMLDHLDEHLDRLDSRRFLGPPPGIGGPHGPRAGGMPR